MKQTILTMVLLLAVAFEGYAQNIFYQQKGTSRVLTQSEFNMRKEVALQKLKSINPNSVIVIDTVAQHAYNDSIVVVYTLSTFLSDHKKFWLTPMAGEVYGLVGKPFPRFELDDSEGKPFSSDDMAGYPVVINFWFTGCKPCRKEMPVLNVIKQKYEGRVLFLSITYHSHVEVADFMRNNDFKFHHLVGATSLISKLGLGGYPKTIIINKSGIVTQVMDCVESVVDANGNVTLGDGREIMKEIEKVLK